MLFYRQIAAFCHLGVLALSNACFIVLLISELIIRNEKIMASSVIKAQEVINLFLDIPDHEIKCEQVRDSSDGSAVVKCAFKDKKYIIKLFDKIDLGKNEITWFKHASKLGIGPSIYQADIAFKYIILEFVDGQSLTLEKAQDPLILKEIAHDLVLLHTSSLVGVQKKEIFPQIYNKYEKLKTGGKLQNLLSNFIQYAKNIQEKVQSRAVPLVPCHNDLNPGNIFIKGDKVIVIDWGDASFGDPYYDIAAFFILNSINKQQQFFFLEHYDKKLLEPYWQEYLELLEHMVYFEFSLNLLRGVQEQKQELLFKQCIPAVKPLEYYLAHFSKETNLEINFFYQMAIASLLRLKQKINQGF